MKVLIIGANGQVGRSLVKIFQLKQEDTKYIAWTRKELDISNKKNIKNCFKSINVDFVINASAYTDVEKAEDEKELASLVNGYAVGWLAQACKVKNIALIHISTDYIFDGFKQGMYSENDQTNPINAYGLSKLDGENSIQNIWGKHIILRASWVFSEYGNNFVKTMIKLSNYREKITIIADQYGSPTSANSIARVIFSICLFIYKSKSFNEWGIYNYTDFPITTWHQFASYVISKNLQAKTSHIEPMLSKDFKTKAKRPQNSALDIHKIKKIFNIKQYQWTKEVDRIIKVLRG